MPARLDSISRLITKDIRSYHRRRKRRRRLTRRHLLVIGGLAAGLALIAAIQFWPRNPRVVRQRAFARATQYMKLGDYASAIIQYRITIKADPRYGEAHLGLGDAYAHVDDARGAFAEYLQSAQLMPDNVDAQIKAGNVLLLTGRAAEASAHADRALRKDPGNLDARILRANAAAGLKNLDDAVTQLYEAADRLPESPADQAKTYLHVGVMELARGHKDEAENVLKKAIQSEPRSIASHLALANFYWALGRKNDAEKELNDVIAIDSNEQTANRALAAIYMYSGRVDRAERPLKTLANSTTDPAPRFLLADYYLVTERPTDAGAILAQLAEETATYAQARLRLSLIEYAGGRFKEAVGIIDESLKREPTHPRLLLMKARYLAEEKKLDEALQKVNASIAGEAKAAEAFYLLGTIQLARRDQAEAIAAFSQVLKLRPKLVDALVHLTRLHLARGDSDTAIRFAEQAVANAPAHSEARIALIHGLLARGNPTQVELELKPLLDANPKVAGLVSAWGRLQMLKHDLNGARQSFMQALELDYLLPEPLNELVTVEITTGRASVVIPLVEDHLTKSPDDPRLLMLAARAYAADNRTEPEEQALRRLIEVDPANLRAYGALGQFYFAAGRTIEARQEFERLASRQPRSVGAQTMLAMIEELEKRPDAAKKRYERALAIDPHAAVAANNLAWMYSKARENLDVALQLAQTAKAQFPNEPEFNDTLGWIYVQKDLVPSGLEALLDSVRVNPKNPLSRYHLGVAYATLGNTKMARVQLEAALRLQTDFEGAAEARRQLAKLPNESILDEEKPAKR